MRGFCVSGICGAPLVAVLVVGLGLVVMVPAAEATQAVTVIADTFSGSGIIKYPGRALNGRTTEVGDRVWVANAGVGIWRVPLGNRWVTNLDTVNSQIAGVPFSLDDYPGYYVAKVEATVVPETSSWMAVGFSSSATGGYWTLGQVWAFLRADGTLVVKANGTAHTLYNAPYFKPGDGAAFLLSSSVPEEVGKSDVDRFSS